MFTCECGQKRDWFLSLGQEAQGPVQPSCCPYLNRMPLQLSCPAFQLPSSWLSAPVPVGGGALGTGGASGLCLGGWGGSPPVFWVMILAELASVDEAGSSVHGWLWCSFHISSESSLPQKQMQNHSGEHSPRFRRQVVVFLATLLLCDKRLENSFDLTLFDQSNDSHVL